MGCKGGNVDPCLYVKKSAKCIVYIAPYVDKFMVGNVKVIDNTTAALRSNGLVLKVMEGLHDNLFGKMKFSTDKKRAWLGQPHLIKNIDMKFGELVKSVCSHKTPFLVVRPIEESEKISMEDQWKYLFGVGMLLYLVKHSHPALASMARELSMPMMVQTLLHTRNF